MAEYGQVLLKAKALKQLGNVSEVIKKGRYEFVSNLEGSNLLISPSDRYFCTDCYYLISVSSSEPATTSILAHTLSTPISIRENRMVRDTLNSDFPQINYMLLRLTPFKANVGVLYGTPTFTITNTKDPQYLFVFVVN